MGQGLLLPLVIRWLGLANAGRRERRGDRAEEFAARRRAIEIAIERLDQLAAERQLPEDIVGPLRTHHRERLKGVGNRSDCDDGHKKLFALSDEIALALIAAERDIVNDLYRRGELKDEGRRRIERELDLRDALIANLQAEA